MAEKKLKTSLLITIYKIRQLCAFTLAINPAILLVLYLFMGVVLVIAVIAAVQTAKSAAAVNEINKVKTENEGEGDEKPKK